MSLLYSSDHQKCVRYASPGTAIFRSVRSKEKNSLHSRDMTSSVIVFVLEGELVIDCGIYKGMLVPAGHFAFLPKGSRINAYAQENTLVLRCIVDNNMRLCDRHALGDLITKVDIASIVYDYSILPVRKRLNDFLFLMVDCLNDGLNCLRYHQSKREELFLLLQAYYTREELAGFFYPILCNEMEFKDLVLSNYRKAKDLQELAALVNMSLVTFNRHFKKAFFMSAAQWMEEQRAGDILHEIQMSHKTFCEISLEYNFSSPSYFTAFCRRKFGKSPKQIRGRDR